MPGHQILEATRVFDGLRLLGPSRITVASDVIVDVSPWSPTDAGTPTPGVLRFDGAHTLLPGLVDCHVHLNLRGDGSDPSTTATTLGVLAARSMANARSALEAGVTTLRDCGSQLGTLDHVVSHAPDEVLPRVLQSGPVLTIPRGHGQQFGIEVWDSTTIKGAVNRLAANGMDFVKVMGSGGGTDGTAAWRPSFSGEQLGLIVQAAHDSGLPVTVHCLDPISVERAVAAGADGIEHAGFITDAAGTQSADAAIVRQVAESGIPVCSTLSNRYFASVASQSHESDVWRKRHQSNIELFTQLAAGGVRMIPGTDAGWRWTHFDALSTELSLMVNGGLSIVESIRAATTGAASVLGLGDTVGQIRAGYVADLLLVRGDPTRDLTALRQPAIVWRAGVPIRSRSEATSATSWGLE